MSLTRSPDFLSGLLLTLAGGAFAYGADAYDIGEASQMGPGYFPRLVGALTVIVGAILILRSALDRSRSPAPATEGPWALRPLAFIVAANLGFGVMVAGLPQLELPPMGLVAGVYVLTVLASFAEPGSKVSVTLALATVLCVIALGITALLSLNIPIWPQFF